MRFKIIFYLSLVVCSFSFFFLSFNKAEAASLYFSPAAGSYTLGQSFDVAIYASSPDQAMNAVSGIISFPGDKLQVFSLSKSGSIINLWVQEPSFSNAAGTINFEGIVLNPGFKGQTAKIITATLKVKGAGSGRLVFSSSAVLANDGKGTNILDNVSGAEFALNPSAVGPQAGEATTPASAAGTPLAPRISSPTHPNPEKWYRQNNPKFIWDIPGGITQVRLLYDKYPASRPTVVYAPSIKEKELENIGDGIWYFHAQFRNENGWGAIAHFKFRIDTQPPEPFTVKFVDGKEPTNPRPTALFDTTDSLSGIAYYKVKIGEGNFFNLLPEVITRSNPYTLSPQAPGKRTILVQAFDAADNYTIATEEFAIKSIDPPTFTDYPREIQSGEILTAKGETYPSSRVTVYLQKDKEEPKIQNIKSGQSGHFTFVSEEPLEPDIYKLWAQTTDERGATSEDSEKIVIAVRRPTLWQLGSWTMNVLAVIVPLATLLIALILTLWYGWQKFRQLRKKVRKDVGRIEQILHKAFDALREDVQAGIAALEKTRGKRQLTEEEEKMLKHLKKSLDNTENIIRAEIEEIEKEVK